MKCYFLHRYDKWKFIETLDELGKPDKLIRKCKKCGKIDEYIGLTNIDIITNEKTPYIHTD